MSSTAKSSQSRKILKIAGIVLGCLFGLVLLATILAYIFLEPYAERYLKERVTEQTDGLYQLEFEELDIDLLSTTIRLSDVHLTPDSSVHRQQRAAGNASRTLIELETNQLELARIDLLDALFNDHLDIESIFIDRPVITLIIDERVRENTGETDLSGFMESVHIGEIKIPDANYRQLVLNESLTPRHIVPNITLGVFDLTLDNLNQSDSASIDAEDFQLAVKNYTFNSPDSVYDVHVELLTYSSKNEELLAEAVRIRADHEANISLDPEEANHTLYDITAPRLFITGLDLLEAYHTRELLIDEIVLERALVDMLENNNIPVNRGFPELSDLYKNVSPYVKAIGVADLRVVDGAVIYRSLIEEILIIHELEDADIALQSVTIDSLTLFTPRDNFYAEEIVIETEGYTYQHPHSPYTIKVAKLDLSTPEDYLYADSIQIIGDWKKNEQLKQIDKAHYIIYNIEAHSLRFKDMDLVAAFQNQKLKIGSIEVANPNIDLLRDKGVEQKEFENWQQDTYQDISGFVTELAIGEIHFQNAFFTQHIKNQNQQVRLSQKLEQASARAYDMYVDSSFIFHSAAIVPLEELVLSARSYTYWMPDNIHTFHLSSLNYSTRSQELRARAIDVSANPRANDRKKEYNNASSRLYDVSSPLFHVTGLDLIGALNKERLDVDQILLREPELTITRDMDVSTSGTDKKQQQDEAGLFALVDPITVNTLRMEDGTFIYREKREEIIRTQLLEHASATLKGIKLGPERLDVLDETLPIEEMVLTARDYTYQSPDSIHTITLDSLHYTSRQQLLTARRFEISADKEAHEQLKKENINKASRNLFDVTASKFQIRGLDLIQAYETGRYNMEEMLLTEPQVSILQDRNVPEKREEEAEEAPAANETGTREQIAEVVETFRVEHFRLAQGSFTFNILEDTLQKSHEVEHVSVAMEQLRLASLNASDPLEMFRVDELGVLIQDYTFLTPDSLYELSIKEIRSSLGEKSLHIDSLHLRPLFDRDKFVDRLEYEDDRFEIIMPSIAFLGINFDALYNEQGLDANRLHIVDPILEIYRDKRIPMDPERRPPTLQNALLNAGFYINIDTVDVEGWRLTYSEVAPEGVKPGQVILDDTRLMVFNVTNDSLLIQENNIATAHGATHFMEESILRVDFQFFLDHPESLHTYEGSLEPMDFEAFNPILENLMFVRVESGRINKAVFSVEATKHEAVGEMKFLYENLEIQLIDKEDKENPGFLRNAGSWLINSLAIKDNNPSPVFGFREGDIDAARDYQKSIFNLMSSAMMNGIASSLMPALVEKIVESTVGLP